MNITVLETQVPVTETVVVYKNEKSFKLELTEREALILGTFIGRTGVNAIANVINSDLRDHRTNKQIKAVTNTEIDILALNIYRKLV
jgi:hypothetical protein